MPEGIWHCEDRPAGRQQVDGPCGDKCGARFFKKRAGFGYEAAAEIDIHTWFGLSYANFLVLHRSILQSMPDEWQRRFVACLQELDEAASDLTLPEGYRVRVVDEEGKFCEDPIPHYNRGRTQLDLNVKAACLIEGAAPEVMGGVSPNREP